MRTLLFIMICVAGFLAHAGEPGADSLARGEEIYAESCASCHGDQGEGATEGYAQPLRGDLTAGGLARLIADTMPEGDPESCVGDDAQAVAGWIHREFYSEAAQVRRRPPRVSLSRLTADQLRQSLADLYASQVGVIRNVEERGLKAQYFDETNMASDKLRLERVDPAIDFDFADAGPGDEITADNFAIAWRGGLLARHSGRYRLLVNSTCAFTLRLGDDSRMLIDNHTQSGDRTEFEASLNLTGGRVYPLVLHLFQRKRKTEQPPANIQLRWVPPEGTEQVIPTDVFLPVHAPPAFALQAHLPPDDRSYGFDRGISVDRAWDEATTAAAVEFADVAARELWPRYREAHKEEPEEGRDRLQGFLTELLAVAFRSELDNTTRTLYIDRQLAESEDDAEAIRRVLLAAIKSPRFLYPLIDADQSPSRRAANRLALALFDSLPADGWLRDRIQKNTIETREQMREVAWGMINDERTRFKTRQMLNEWLPLPAASDISKDGDLFPGFDSDLVNDLRESFDRFLDDIVWSDESDYRQLFFANRGFTNERLAAFYGNAWRAENPGSSWNVVRFDNQQAGLLRHPWVTGSLAYRDSTSPIHRGVFLLRHVLGRPLRPPNEAFTPLSPDLHPGLTTRERVERQTGAESCQVCHRKINGLGFVLENLDTVGRWRDADRGKRIDSRGHYVSRSGEEIRFNGVDDLSEYLANSADAHRAFVDRAFRHFVKQPPAAWGPDTLDHLTQRFEERNCSIRLLIIDIATTAAIEPEVTPEQ